jgi:hypothetical protein
LGLDNNKGEPEPVTAFKAKHGELPWLQGVLKASKELWIMPLLTDDRLPLPLSIRWASVAGGLGTII